MFLDTGNINEIKAAMKCGIFKGVTTNPTILLKEKKPREEQVTKALNRGCHTATLPYDVFKQMLEKSLALDAIKVFNEYGMAQL